MAKKRLTITLSESVLKQVDHIIDKHTIRNRSHAIEHLINKSLQPSVNQAIILAGGKKDEQNEVIRPLTMVNNKPLIQHTIEHFKQFGITSFVIATSKRGKVIQEVIGDGSNIGVTIQYVFENFPLGTAGAVKHSSHKLSKNPFLVIAGDTLTTINVHDFISFHRENKGFVTVAVKPRPTKETYDNVYIQGNTVVDFQASTKLQTVSIVNTGIYIFEHQALQHIKYARTSMLEKDLFPLLSKKGQMKAFTFQGLWFDVSSDENYKSLDF